MKEYLLNCIDRTFDDEDYYKINKYIEDLEERIDKAIEYINSYAGYDNNFCLDYHDLKPLLEILRSEDNE